MQVLPGMIGAMVNWPEVKVVDGARSVLEMLSKQYPCYVATNADDSNAIQVMAALARVGLDKFIYGVFTKQETGYRKTCPEFYLSLADLLKVPPDQMIMIGDDFVQDILSAHRAGLRTIWLNSRGDELPSCLPYQDAEVPCLDGIFRVMENKFPPTIETCNNWLEEYRVPENIRFHMQAVADHAYKLTVKVQHANVPVDPILVHRAAWLHDIGKLQESSSNSDHGAVGADILRGKGEDELSEIIDKHVVERILNENPTNWSWNAKIVFYVDKCFEGEKYLEIDERLTKLGIRYPESKEEISKALPMILELENQIKLLLL